MKVLKKIGVIALGLFMIISGVLAGAFIVLNVMQVTYFHEYYSVKKNENPNYALNYKDYAPQGVEYIPSIDHYITSAYSGKSENASKIFVDKRVGFDLIDIDDSLFQGHVGGIAVHESSNSLLIASEKYLHRVQLDELTSNMDSVDKLHIVSRLELPFETAFVFVENDNVYTGEFYNGDKYTGSGYKTTYNDEENNAILVKLDINSVLNEEYLPLAYYALPNKVQGVAIKDDHIYLSTSYGLSLSWFYIYKMNDLPVAKTSISNEEVNVNFLSKDNLVRALKGPWMAEDLAIKDGKLITHFESASNKYIFGKFYFANYIVSLDILI